MRWDRTIFNLSHSVHLLIPLNPLSFSNLGSDNKITWDACLKKHVAMSHTYFFLNFLIFSIFRVVWPALLILDYVHHPSKKTWIYSLILPFLWPLATIIYFLCLWICLFWAGVGPRQLLPEALRCCWLEHSISPEASTCRQVRQSPREETASQVTLKFITLRRKGVLLIIMQGHKAYPGMYGYPLRMELSLF